VEPAADEGYGLQHPRCRAAIPGIDSTAAARTPGGDLLCFAEDNMELTDTTMLTPALRFDHHTSSATTGARP
jgi:hypothetical protein